jgi:DNA-directed RNA polymerase subunit L
MQDIEIQTGFGRDHATFNNATRTFITHLDLEQYSDSEIRNGIASDLSGYKTSSLVANPRHHRLTVSFPATGEDPGDVRAFLAGACRAVAARLRIIANATSDNEARGAQYSAVALQGGLFEGTLLLPGETHTIGALMRRYVYVVDPGVSFLGYDVDEHKNWLTLTVRSASDVTATITRAAAIAIGVFATIQAGIEKIPLSPAPGKGARA